MSIVGPRPERPEFVQTLSEVIPFYRQRHSVKPGITGWAQINYKYGETIEDAIVKLEFDLYYIKNLSLSLDMYIIFHTMKAMLVTQSGQSERPILGLPDTQLCRYPYIYVAGCSDRCLSSRHTRKTVPLPNGRSQH